MSALAYYNEFDPLKAAWLAELMSDGLIAPGVIDDRSITDVLPCDLDGFTQCHFFAGIGVWSYALRCAGWPDDRPVWTGSCPCPSFSTAGRGDGFRDLRHLWPAWFGLVRECKPGVVFGEQVEAAIRHGWLDLVSTDLEGEGYAIGSAVLGAHSVGAPHIRQRLYFVAQSEIEQHDRGRDTRRGWGELTDGGAGELGHPCPSGLPQRERDRRVQPEEVGAHSGEASECGGNLVGVGHPNSQGRTQLGGIGSGQGSPWAVCDWLPCRDGKYRPTQPGVAPLVDGPARLLVSSSDPSSPVTEAEANASTEARVMRLRGYGDAIVAPLASAFIRCYLEV